MRFALRLWGWVIVGTLVAGVSLESLAADTEVPRSERPPNIVLIVIDDLGWRDLGCYGSDLYETPHVDRLAREGMRFTNAYSACTVCSPSRAALLTGKYPARLRVTDWIPGHERPDAKLKIPDWTQRLELSETTLAELLASAGYICGHVGKWHLGPQGFWPTEQGFAVNIGGCDLGAPPSYYWPYTRASRRLPTLELTPATQGQYLTDRLAEETAALIRQWKARPFFLYLATYQVHMPLEPKKTYVAKYAQRVRPGMRHTNPRYAAMVQSMDEFVGKVLDALDRTSLAGNTIVFFTSDNGGLSHLNGVKRGPTDNWPLRLGKGSSYEGGVRVPLIVRWPGRTPPGTVCHAPVMGIDLFPTVAEIIGHPVASATGSAGQRSAALGRPESGTSADAAPQGAGNAKPAFGPVDGISLVPLLRKPKARLPRDALFWHYPHYHPGGATPYGAVRAGPWKLIEFYEDMRVELYNLDDDLGEQHDRAPSRPDLVTALRDQLHRWRQNVGAQMPTARPGQ